MQATKESLDLLMQGSRLFSRMEANGIRIDVPYLEEAIHTTGIRIKELEEELTNSKTQEIGKGY
jgi:DNA polymerase I-like protein with 3'-5' exonuclease and polymerase domains